MSCRWASSAGGPRYWRTSLLTSRNPWAALAGTPAGASRHPVQACSSSPSRPTPSSMSAARSRCRAGVPAT
eukprot:11622330-Alexandrium_andersonii.AAC.1